MGATVETVASGSMSSLIGKPLQGGKYKLDEVLGRGGFGLTFRAHQTYLDQVVVIKTLNESHWDADNIDDLQRQFQAEGRRLAMCSHPNVVRVSDFFVEDGLPYMVMDYIPGRSLSDIVLPDNPLSETVAVTYATQIGRALQAVHARGLLHRDVKPQNIMIHQLTGKAVLIDFGIARELTKDSAQTHTSIVSEGYAPIEQYLPRAHRSAATDVYGLAATLYTLLTARVPVAAVLRDRTPLVPIEQVRPDVSDAVVGAIAHGMAVELKDRPQSVGPWLSELAGKTRTRLPRTQKPDARGRSTPSAVPTKVVAPARASTRYNQVSAERTVAAPPPAGYSVTAGESYTPAQPKSRGCGCVSTLAILGIAVAGAVAGGGYWLYQQTSDGFAARPDLPEEINLPEGLEFPEVEFPGGRRPERAEQETLEGSEDSADEGSSQDEDATDVEEDGADEYISLPDRTTSDGARGPVPIALRAVGSPADDVSSSGGELPAVRGIPPGASEDRVRELLGSPDEMTSIDGYDTAVYRLVPNRVELAYTYGAGDVRVKQSEAVFSPSTDGLVARTALLGMLDGRSTREIEDGLAAVRAGRRDRFSFEREGFSGAIEKNANGYVHIYVRN